MTMSRFLKSITPSFLCLCGLLLGAGPAPATETGTGTGTLPQWVAVNGEPDRLLQLEIPGQMGMMVRGDAHLEYVVLRLEPTWQPDWKQAAFQLKGQIVAIKTNGPRVRVGLEGSEAQVQALLAHELAPYIEGYVFVDDPFIPKADETGKLWQRLAVPEKRVLGALVALGEDEVRDLVEKEGQAFVTCEFCNEQYTINRTDLEALFALS